MKTKYLKQLNKKELLDLEFDLIIASCGYESRASYISELLYNKCKNKYVFSFTDNTDLKIRLENDKKFIDLGFKSISCEGNNANIIVKQIDEFISKNDGTLSILIDYSSMTRVWYGNILIFFRNLNIEDRLINIFFTYSESEFHLPANKDSTTSHFEPIDGFCNLSIPSFPTALITGLGYEKNKAFGLKDFFDAEQLYLFYTQGNGFTQHVKTMNNELIEMTPIQNIIQFNLNDILLTKNILYELCLNLMKNFRVIIAPCGPKPFTILSLLVASELDSIDVWRISGQDIGEHSNKKASGDIISFMVCYE